MRPETPANQLPEPDAPDGGAGNDAGGDSDASSKAPQPREIGGRGGLDPCRYGDWEKNGRCIDF